MTSRNISIAGIILLTIFIVIELQTTRGVTVILMSSRKKKQTSIEKQVNQVFKTLINLKDLRNLIKGKSEKENERTLNKIKATVK